MTRSESRQPRNTDRIIVWTRSGGLCNFPGCRKECATEATDTDQAALIGDLGHIEASSDQGPRANPSLTMQERHSHPNLILFCPNHHRLVDSQPNTYPAETLRKWKADVEERYHSFLVQSMGELTFAELTVIMNSLVVGSLCESGRRMWKNDITASLFRVWES